MLALTSTSPLSFLTRGVGLVAGGDGLVERLDGTRGVARRASDAARVADAHDRVAGRELDELPVFTVVRPDALVSWSNATSLARS